MSGRDPLGHPVGPGSGKVGLDRLSACGASTGALGKSTFVSVGFLGSFGFAFGTNASVHSDQCGGTLGPFCKATGSLGKDVGIRR